MTDHLDVGDQIYDIIQRHPGIHFRGIQEILGKEVGVLDYHLNKLTQEESIISVRHRKHKLFFERKWEARVNELTQTIDNLRKSTPRAILLSLAKTESKNLSIKQLADKLKKTPSNLHWHIKRLIEDGLVEAIRKGRKVSLQLKISSKILNNLGNEIYPTRWEKFLDDIEDRFGR